MKLHIFTDGGAKGNPGPAAIGVVIYNAESGEELQRYREDIGTATNNEAEYTAVIRALELVNGRWGAGGKEPTTLERIDFFADSQLLVKQLNGEYKIKTPHILDLVMSVRAREADLHVPIYFHHIPRSENALADALVNDKA